MSAPVVPHSPGGLRTDISKGLTTAYGQGASDSDLHLTFTDPVSGSQALSQTRVKVEKA